MVWKFQWVVWGSLRYWLCNLLAKKLSVEGFSVVRYIREIWRGVQWLSDTQYSYYYYYFYYFYYYLQHYMSDGDGELVQRR